MAHHFPASNDSTAWFEALYAHANHDARAVPWANLTAHPDLVEWFHQRGLRGDGQKALVVGCGLGDDAEALSASGFAVTAFDVSPTAIDWCQRRFPNSGVDYQVADLFQTPPAWREHFDFALEIRTIQSLPPTLHDNAMQYIAQHVAPGGTLLLVCQGREAGFDVDGPPWPLVRTELDAFPRFGLEEVAFKETLLRSNPLLWTYRVEYRRPLSR